MLRGIDRDGTGATDPVANFPDWLTARWRQTYGEAALQAMAKAASLEPPTDLSLRPGTDAGALAEALEACILAPDTLRTDRRGDLRDWAGFEDGLWWVQDAAAAVPARLLEVRADHTGLDLCAAPGGKTLQLAATGATVTALDRSDKRLDRLRDNLKRMGLSAEVIASPAEDWDDADRKSVV